MHPQTVPEEFKLPSHSMESNDGNSERLQPPSPKRIKTITPFEDHPDDADTVNLHSSTNPEDQALKYPSPSDCGSGVLSPDDEQKPWLSNGFVRIGDGDMRYETITKTLVARLSSCGFSAQVETIHRNGYSSMMSRARLHSFGIYSQAIQTRSNGNGNVKYAWYGASKHGISEILSYGFGLPLNNGVYGHGVYLSTVDHPVESLQSSTADEDGLRHMLLCRVLLGNPEVISPGSGQYHPSSQEFDSGVDNLTSPKKYIVWTTKMNTHIMPEYVVSFRILSCCNGYPKILEPPKHPSSDWMHLDTLIKALPEFLPAAAIKSLSEHHNEYKKQKITRHAMIQRVRHVVGDELLMLMIKSYGEKIKASSGSNTDDRLINERI